MIGRVVWIAVLAVIGIAVTFIQLDRSARFHPELASTVASPFRSFAQPHLIGRALADNRTDEAFARARELVSVRPAPAENLVLLSRTALLAGDAETGIAALEEAGRRGWREQYSQQAMARAALLSDNPEGASQRIAALLATGAMEQGMVEPLLAELVVSPEGRTALARRLTEDGHWQPGFLQRGAAMIGLASYADIIARAWEINARFDCGSTARIRANLVDAGREDLVAELAHRPCKTAKTLLDVVG